MELSVFIHWTDRTEQQKLRTGAMRQVQMRPLRVAELAGVTTGVGRSTFRQSGAAPTARVGLVRNVAVRIFIFRDLNG